MSNLENLIQKLCTDTHCTFVLMAHAERETDEVQGGSEDYGINAWSQSWLLASRDSSAMSCMPKRKALSLPGPRLSRMRIFKNRNLPLADNLPPDFAQIITSWEKHGGTIGAE